MKTRATKAKRSQPRKGQRQRGVQAFNSIETFDEVLTLADGDFSDHMKSVSTPTWKEGAKNVDPFLLWSYTKTVCDCSKRRVKKGDYDTTVLSLSKCRKQDLEKKEGYACSNRTIQPWVEVKKSAIKTREWDSLPERGLIKVTSSPSILHP